MRLLIGVSGGIAAYKALETVRLATGAGHAVRVIQTPASELFVGRASFQALSGAPVVGDEHEPDLLRGAYPGEPAPDHAPISHLELVARADVYLIAPATANTLAKLAAGMADNLLTAAALAAPCPVLVAPAMNNRMYLHPATQANVATLRARGVIVIDPGEGELASRGEHGIGRLAEPEMLLAACERAAGRPGRWPPAAAAAAAAAGSAVASADPEGAEGVEVATAPDLSRAPAPVAPLATAPEPARADYAGVRVLVTAGGTQEPIDSVRFIGNRSSGRMGYALAAAAAARGAEVTLIAANVALPDPADVRVVAVRTAAQLGAAAAAAFDSCDVLLMAAAVADFRPAKPVAHKLKKDSAEAPSKLKLKATEDVLRSLSRRRRPGQLLIGFAAEHGSGAIAYGRAKLARKHLDAVVVNDISRPEIGFESLENEVTILTRGGAQRQLSRARKEVIADALLDAVLGLRELTVATES